MIQVRSLSPLLLRWVVGCIPPHMFLLVGSPLCFDDMPHVILLFHTVITVKILNTLSIGILLSMFIQV